MATHHNKECPLSLTNFFYADPFRDGMAVIYDDGMNKSAFINRRGKVVIPVRYDLASDFSGGPACVAIQSTENSLR